MARCNPEPSRGFLSAPALRGATGGSASMPYRDSEARSGRQAVLAAFLDAALPAGCVWAARADFTCDPPLTLAERAYSDACHPKRAAEFRAGRDCAAAALGALGAPPGPLGRGDDRLPCWPTGFLGSITHCNGLCLAITAREGVVSRVACDAEPNRPLPEDVAPRILSRRERAAQTASGLPDRLWFSAKECVFKAVFPDVRGYFGFEEADVILASTGSFEAMLSPSIAARARVDRLTGRWVAVPEFLVTVIAN